MDLGYHFKHEKEHKSGIYYLVDIQGAHKISLPFKNLLKMQMIGYQICSIVSSG